MNKRLLSVLAFAFVVALGASLVLYRLISTKLLASAKQPAAQLVVASRNLEIGTLIKDADLKTIEWSGTAPKGAVLNPTDLVGRGVIANIYEGEPILETRLATKGAGAGMAATIPPGMRAVAVRVNEVVGVAGFVVPGMRVDVLIAGNPPGANTAGQGTLTKTLLQNIEVLSAGQNIQKDAEGKPVSVAVVNLLVTPEQAEILSLASSETRLQLVLRNPLDTETVKTPGTTVSRLFNGQTGPMVQPAPAPAPKPPRPAVVQAKVTVPQQQPNERERVMIPIMVEVIHGTKRAETKFTGGEAGK
jgi:pilus assembly protein CpaB